ncbi:MAG: tetratricopeptide repeat protein [Candidatus Manganitrophaceae bacterium]|nr:MAG: tetratricopeptide repeat protein [Candidatus Manganitrophaceae bacterium]
MKKWIVPIMALALGLGAATAFAKAPVEPMEAHQIKNKEAKKEFKEGVKAFNKEKYSEAVQHFTAAEQAEPSAPETHINLALALAKEGKADEAKKHFDRATELLSGGGTASPGQGGAPAQKSQPQPGSSGPG